MSTQSSARQGAWLWVVGLFVLSGCHARLYVPGDDSSAPPITGPIVDPLLAPPTPLSLIATAVSPSKVRLSWSSGGGSTVDYSIVYQAGATPPADCETGTEVHTGSTTYAVLQLNALSNYSFRVCARNSINLLDEAGGATASATTSAVSHVQAKAADINTFALGATIAVTLNQDTVSGNLLLVCPTWDVNGSSTVNSVSDPQGNTYQLIEQHVETSNAQAGACYYAANITGGVTPTITVTLSTPATWRGLTVHEIAGASTTTPIGSHRATVQGNPATSVDAVRSGEITARNGSYVFGWSMQVGGHNATAAGTGFIQDTQEARGTAMCFTSEHRIQVGNGRREPTFTATTSDAHVTFAIEIVSEDTDSLTPPEPSSLHSTSQTSSQISLGWTSGAGSTDSFVVAYRSGLTAPFDCRSDTVSNHPGTLATITGLAAATTYAFRVCAVDAQGNPSEGITLLRATSGLAHVQSTAADVGDGSIAPSLSRSWDYETSPGNTVIVCASWGSSGATASVSDNLGNTYQTVDDISDGGNNQRQACFYSRDIVGGSPVVTVTYSTPVVYRALVMHEISGASRTAPLGAHTGQQQGSPAASADGATSGTASVLAGSYLFGFSALTGSTGETAAAGTGFTVDRQESRNSTLGFTTEHRIASASAMSAATFTPATSSARVSFLIELRP